MTLQLNQQAIPGQEIKVTIKVNYGDTDLSGQGDSTDTAETGIKAKTLLCSLVVPFDQPQWLTTISTLGENTDKETGRRVIYRIGHDAANAIKFYEGKFSGELNITELEDTQAWQVSFTLREHLSVPERKAQREVIVPATQQGGDTGVTSTEDDQIPPNTQLSNIERILAYTDDKLGGLMGSDTVEV